MPAVRRPVLLFLAAAVMLALGVGLTLLQAPVTTTTGTLASAQPHAQHNHPDAVSLLVNRDVGGTAAFVVDSTDDRFRPGQRVEVTSAGANVRSITLLSDNGDPLGTVRFRSVHPLLIFLPCGLIFLWLGFRQRSHPAT